MKGLIFTEFLEYVEQEFGLEAVDHITQVDGLTDGGAYTSIGYYNDDELVSMVVSLSQMQNLSVPQVLRSFGRSLFPKLATAYPRLLAGIDDDFDLLEKLESHIHVQVAKLYPEVTTPSFETKRIDSNTLELIYRSHRKMGDVAEGLMLGCGAYFGKEYSITSEALSEDGTIVKFVIKR